MHEILGIYGRAKRPVTRDQASQDGPIVAPEVREAASSVALRRKTTHCEELSGLAMNSAIRRENAAATTTLPIGEANSRIVSSD